MNREFASDFEQIYHANIKAVYNLALHYVQNIEDAQEISQDVFVSVHESFTGFRQDAALSTWIYRITINKSLDFIKAKKRKKRFAFLNSLFFDNGAIKHDSPNFNHPGVQMEQKESLKLIFDCINSLPDNQRTALILAKIEQKSQIEIAAIMNMNVKAIESLIHRAKQNLLKKLNQNEG